MQGKEYISIKQIPRMSTEALERVMELDKYNGLTKAMAGLELAKRSTELCGSDMSSLEDRMKQHYMWKHDPEYVKEM